MLDLYLGISLKILATGSCELTAALAVSIFDIDYRMLAKVQYNVFFFSCI